MHIPTLTSERLVLRPFEGADFEPMAAFYADPGSAFYGGPLGREDAWRKFAMYPGHWSLRGYGPFAIAERDSGHFVGLCGPWYPEGWEAPEITWALVPDARGKGYATEAARRALRHAVDDLGWTTVISLIAVENTPSIAVAERLGAVREREAGFRYGRAFVYRHVP